MTVTAIEAAYYAEVCDEGGNEQLTAEEACNWVILGFPAQGALTLESVIMRLVLHVEAQARYIDLLRAVVQARAASPPSN